MKVPGGARAVLRDVLSPWRVLPPLAQTLAPLLETRPESHVLLDHVVSRLRARNVLHPFTFFSEGFEAAGGAPAGALPRIRHAAALALEAPFAPPASGVALTPSPHGRSFAHVAEGAFAAPAETRELLPPAARTARFELVTPSRWAAGGARPVAVLLPGTGEQGFTRRRHWVSYPLAERGVASVILEGPFYGTRRPPAQAASKVRGLCDLPLLGLSTMLEARALVAWLRARGHGAVVLAGGSMGGLHAAMTACLLPCAVGVASWLGPPSGVGVFTSGSLASAVNWRALAAGADKPRVEEAVAHMERLLPVGCFQSALPPPGAARALEVHWPDVPPDALARAVALAARLLRITDLGAFPPPAAPHLAVFVHAAMDQYVPHDEAHWAFLRRAWAGAVVRRLDKGHVTGSLALDEYVALIAQLARRVGEEAGQSDGCAE